MRIAEGINQDINDILSEKGITHFTEVQGKAYKPVVAGRDVIGRSSTGTGKNLAFGLPAMTRLQNIAEEICAEEKGAVDSQGRRKRGSLPSMLILCPTRSQIAAAAKATKEGTKSATQEKIFGKTIVFTETKRDADELVSRGVFKSLTAQVCSRFDFYLACA